MVQFLKSYWWVIALVILAVVAFIIIRRMNLWKEYKNKNVIPAGADLEVRSSCTLKEDKKRAKELGTNAFSVSTGSDGKKTTFFKSRVTKDDKLVDWNGVTTYIMGV